MHLIPLGVAAGGVPGPGGAGSGYLVQEGSTSLLLDCGNGVLGNLARYVPLQRVDAVYISHLHPDHFSDLYPLLLQRTKFAPLTVHAPPGAKAKLDKWFDLLSSNPGVYRSALDLREYEPDAPIKAGPFRVTPRAMEHNVPSFGCTVEAARRTLAYSSDTRLCPQLADLARDAQLFLCEATLQEGVGDAEFNRRQLHAHLTAAQAGQVAAKANCRALALTHIMYYLDAGLSVAQAQKECLCPVTAAKEHAGLRV
ncbi:MAG: MBL fold metallo-hydrolase [Halobacteriales archaeon]|nr:MBL fold metallo-hydrolase [Halobacteriales archaeon]